MSAAHETTLFILDHLNGLWHLAQQQLVSTLWRKPTRDQRSTSFLESGVHDLGGLLCSRVYLQRQQSTKQSHEQFLVVIGDVEQITLQRAIACLAACAN
jgi:hypothetical protein